MKTKQLIIGIALCCTPGVLVAGGGDGKSAAEAEFKKADANGDAKVSPAEHATCAKDMFANMDGNEDGKVTVVEMEAAHTEKMGKKREKAEKAEMSAAEKIKTIDTNGDGVLTAEEHSTGARTMFAKMDTDQDGFLTKTELVEGHARLLQKHDRQSSS
jgi:Ca2+-binding EF-hand superfamily protein